MHIMFKSLVCVLSCVAAVRLASCALQQGKYHLVVCQSAYVEVKLGCVATAGMQDIDKQTSQALLDFSYHLAIGDTNEAYKVTDPHVNLE